MMSRTRRENMVFRSPFLLKGWAEPHPAGVYTVEIEEELVQELSFPVYRRVSTTITRQAIRAGDLVQVIPVDPRNLVEAQATDSA